MLPVDPFFTPFFYYSFYQAHPEWYESFDRYRPGSELFRIARSIVPPTWRVQRDGVWNHAAPPKGQLPEQGWKIHISATPLNCQAVLRRTVEICVEKEIAFKHLVDRHLVSLTTWKGWARESSGKFITIYPSSDRHFEQIIETLYVALREFDGPYILSDKRYKDARVIYYRYGAISGYPVLIVSGRTERWIQSPNGNLTPDLRMPFFSPPDWVSDPFPTDDVEGKEATLYLNDGRYQIERTVGASVSGGVYVATDLDNGRSVLIKEARPHTSVNDDGRDAVHRLQKEHRLLEKLQDTGVTPVPIDLFWDWEHLFAVQEFIHGGDFIRFIVTSAPLMVGDLTWENKEQYVELIRRVWTNLALGIEAIHAEGVIFGDLSLRNILLTSQEFGDIRIVDLEGAWEKGVDTPTPQFGTPGFRPAEGVRGEADDIYTLGAAMLGTLFPMNSLMDLKPSAKGIFIEEMAADLGLPEQMKQLVLKCMADNEAERPNPARIVEVLSNLDVPQGNPPVQCDLSKAELLSTVDGILNYIHASADFHRQDRLFPADPNVFVTNPLSITNGAVGIAYALSRITGEVPESIIPWILSQSITPEQYAPGLYIGSSGIAWGLWELGLHEIALQTMRATLDHPLLWDSADMLYGAAGRGMACLHFYLATGDQEWLDQAVEVGEWLLRSKVEDDQGYSWPAEEGNVWLGYGRGASGIALYLLSLSLASEESLFLSAGKKALAYDLAQERELPSGKIGIPRTPASAEGSRHRNVVSSYWSDGTAGVCTTLIRFWASTRDLTYLDKLKQFIPDTFRKYTAFPSLFLGLAGLGNTLLDVYDFTGDEYYLQKAQLVAKGVSLFSIKRASGIAFPGHQLYRISTDFGTGSAGIALFYHRLAHADQRLGDFNFTLDQLL